MDKVMNYLESVFDNIDEGLTTLSGASMSWKSLACETQQN
jgi:hypothetical protein